MRFGDRWLGMVIVDELGLRLRISEADRRRIQNRNERSIMSLVFEVVSNPVSQAIVPGLGLWNYVYVKIPKFLVISCAEAFIPGFILKATSTTAMLIMCSLEYDQGHQPIHVLEQTRSVRKTSSKESQKLRLGPKAIQMATESYG